MWRAAVLIGQVKPPHAGNANRWVAEMNILDELVKDLKAHGDQFSWDLPADERFAKIIGDRESESIIHHAVISSSVSYFRLGAVKSTGITSKRLIALRKLQKRGIVEASWTGLGLGGRSEFGVGRVRCYSLV